jgi:uncharacterized protein YkwD
MKNIIKKTFIHRNEKMPYLWTGAGVSLLSIVIIGLIVFAQFNQYLFLKINHSLSGLVINSIVVEDTNQERQSLGLGELKSNEALRKAAQAKADDMAKNGYFAHQSPDGKTPWYWIDQTGYTYRAAGENLAVNFDYSRDVVNAWMNSPTHKANIVKSKYQDIGIGIAEGFYQGRPTVFVVQLFGTPKEEMGFGNLPVSTTGSVSGTNVGSTTAISAGTATSTTNVLGASFDTISLYELIFSGKIRTIVLSTIIILIIIVLLLALMNPSGKMIVRIAKMALIPLSILLILYVLLIFKSGSAETSFAEFYQ